MLNTFYDTGEVDASRNTHQTVNFEAGPGWPGLAKIMLGIVLVLIVVL